MSHSSTRKLVAQSVTCTAVQNSKLYFGPEGDIRFGVGCVTGSEIYMVHDGVNGFLACGERVVRVVALIPSNDRYAILDRISRNYISASRSKLDHKGNVYFDRAAINAWEEFDLSNIPVNTKWSEKYFDIVDDLKPDSLLDIISKDHNCSDWRFIEYGLSMLTQESVSLSLAKHLKNIKFLLGLRAAASKSRFLSMLLDSISLGLGRRPPAFIGIDKDFIGHHIDPRDPWIKLSAAIRKNIPKTKRSCVVATARNEGVYLVEWVAYNLELGFDKIFIYTNDNQDGSLELLKALHDAGHIELVISEVGEGGNAQVKAYNHALLINAEVLRYEWCAFIDVDEFISLDSDRFSGINDFLEWQGAAGANSVALTWKLVANRMTSEDWISTPITQRITKLSGMQSYRIKCISKPQEMHLSGPHYPLANGGLPPLVIDSEARRYHAKPLSSPGDITQPLQPTTKNAYLYHYETKSFPELLWKYSRNRGNYAAVRSDIFINDSFLGRIRHFKKCLESPEAEPVRLSVASVALQARIDLLLASQGVRRTYEEVLEKTRVRYDKLARYLPVFLAGDIDPGEYDCRDWIMAHAMPSP